MCKTRWNYELVVDFINNNSNCALLSTKFKTAKDKMLFRCECSNEFETTFEKFKNRNKRQCNDCGFKNQLEKQTLSYNDVQEYVEKNSNCILLEDKFINTKTKMKFQCGCSKVFYKTFEKFRTKSKMCKECSYLEISKSQTFTYDYVKYYIESKDCELLSLEYGSCDKILTIRCKCGEVYKTSFNDFKNDNQIRCRRCSNKMSKGEILIENYLRKNDIEYEMQYTFDDLKANDKIHYLKFDFAIWKNKNFYYLIEFDGKQHSKPVDFYGGIEAFKVLQDNDNKKNEYCINNNINLLRIPYNSINEIENILNNLLIINNDNTVPS